ncbi:hypothetical protein RHSIM_Rhsim03G0243600 [Rhododendron simsii]|uniref:Late embryogenesis abundant protein LEA-2 subgroup domain-containing protein n=1 Tax=Rhododendron simsii TaxID=118357 RepID=A0A834LP64_RHOSS|nr:hypothetical protein RHSIM_Rhsim03G0243600 [Rhododendron simsii]
MDREQRSQPNRNGLIEEIDERVFENENYRNREYKIKNCGDAIFNRDFFSLRYSSLVVSVGYRGRELGFVTSDGGEIRARGSSYVNATLVLDGLEVVHDVVYLVEDLARGLIPFDTDSVVKGTVGIFFVDVPIKVAACISYRHHARRIHHDGACTGTTLDALWVNTRTASPDHHPVPLPQPPLLVVARLLSPSEPLVASPEHSICGPMPISFGLSEENLGSTSFSSLPPYSPFYSWAVMELEEWLEEKRICVFSHYIGSPFLRFSKVLLAGE